MQQLQAHTSILLRTLGQEKSHVQGQPGLYAEVTSQKKSQNWLGYSKFGKTPFAKAQVFLLLGLWLCQLFGLSLVARL